MKKAAFIFILTVLVSGVKAQGVFDAMKYVSTDIHGTARYVAMGGSMGALGGDASAVADNPAALGLYRSNEVTLTGILSAVNSTSNWGATRSASETHFKLGNGAIALSFLSGKDKGLIANNLSFSYNRLKNFTRVFDVRSPDNHGYSMTGYMAGMADGLPFNDVVSSSSYNAYNNTNVGWLPILGAAAFLIDTLDLGDKNWTSILSNGEKTRLGAKVYESGGIDEYTFNYGGNVSDLIYYGLGFGLTTIDYSMTSSYGELFQNGGEFSLDNNFRTKGLGWNFKFGIIARPISFLRLGFSLQTPTLYTMRDTYSASIGYAKLGVNNNNGGTESTPYGISDYRFNTPLQLQASIGFVIKKFALINFDYQFKDASGTTRFSTTSNDNSFSWSEPAFTPENNDIKNMMKATHTFKVGVEYKPLPALALRAGFAQRTPYMTDNSEKLVFANSTRTDVDHYQDRGSTYASGGVGYRYKGFSIDLAYQWHQNKQYYYVYGNEAANRSSLTTINHNIALTLGLKF